MFSKAVPLEDGLPDAIENGDVGPKDDPKNRSKKLCDDFGWDKNDTLKIWSFGPENTGPNMLVDTTKGV